MYSKAYCRTIMKGRKFACHVFHINPSIILNYILFLELKMATMTTAHLVVKALLESFISLRATQS